MKQQININCTFQHAKLRSLSVLLRGYRSRARNWRPPARTVAVQATNLEVAYRNYHAHLEEHQGPVQVLELPGRGRGIVASAALSPGQLVMISKPLAFLTCPMGGIPSPEELADTEDDQDDDLLEQADANNQQFNEKRLFGIIGCNSFGEEASDLPTAYSRAARAEHCKDSSNDPRSDPYSGNGGAGGGRGDGNGGGSISTQPQPVGHLGLFPSFSMLNHSCTPNAVNFVAGEAMCVMAARTVPQGSEVTINYLGRAALRPVTERQALLSEAYHFACDCPRCQAELLCDCGGGGGGGVQAGMGAGTTVAGGGLEGSGSFGEAVQELLARCELREHTLAHNMRSSHPAAAPPAPAATSATGAGAAATSVSGGTATTTIPGDPSSEDKPAGTTDCTGQPSTTGDTAPPSSTEFDILLAEVRQDVATLDECIRQACAAVALTSSLCSAGDNGGGGAHGDGGGRAMVTPSDSRSNELPVWLAASAFDLLSQHAALAEAAGRLQEAAAAVGRQLAVCEEVAPGSDLHLYLAVKALGLVQATEEAVAAAAAGGGGGGREAGAGAAAMARCRDVVRRRYGSEVSEETMGLLLRGVAWGLSQVVV